MQRSIPVNTFFATAGLAMACLTPAVAATFTVTSSADTTAVTPAVSPLDSNGSVTLRSAIMAANAQAGADVIEIPAGMVIKLTIAGTDSGLGDIHPERGDLDITDALTINGHGAKVDANGIDRAFDIQRPALTDFQVAINDLTVTGGAPKGFLAWGGGINVRAATLVMKNCNVSLNTTLTPPGGSNGGGIAVSGAGYPSTVHGTLDLTNTTVSGNKAVNGGAIVGSSCAIYLTNCSLADNATTGSLPAIGGGGALFVTGADSVVKVTGGSILRNISDADGGGVSVFTAPVALTNVAVASNTSAGNGGGACESTVSPGSYQLVGSTFSQNKSNGPTGSGGATYGGAIDATACTFSGNSVSGSGGGSAVVAPGSATFTNCTFSANNAASAGGAIYIKGTSAKLFSCTVTLNTSPGAAGVQNAGTFAIKGTILSGNLSSGPAPDFAGGFTSGGYNLVGTGSGTAVPGTGDTFGVTNPKLGPLQDNGGPAFTHMPLTGSLAIDHGAPGVAGVDFPATDERGFPRPQDGDGNGTAISDIGAAEVTPSTLADAARALRLAGGLLPATAADLNLLNVVNVAAGKVDVADAIRLARKAGHVDTNP